VGCARFVPYIPIPPPQQVNPKNPRIFTSSPSNQRTIKVHNEANAYNTFPIPLLTRWVLALAALTPVTAMAVDAVPVAYVSSSACLKPWFPNGSKTNAPCSTKRRLCLSVIRLQMHKSMAYIDYRQRQQSWGIFE